MQAPLLEKILIGVLAAMLLAAIPLMLAEKWFPSAMLMLTELALFGAWMAARRNRARLAGWLILVPLTLCVFTLIAVGKGPLDESILTLPALMMFAGLFVSRRLYISFLVAILLWLGLVALGHYQGWRVLPISRVYPDTFITVAVILTATSYYVWLLASALRQTLANLQVENQRVRDSMARIEVLAHHDALTGLPNRTLARDRFERVATHAQRQQSMAAVLYLDLDNFKTVNDSLGHAAGDVLLCGVAARLAATVRADDTVSRQGGDEFLIVLGNISGAEAVAEIGNKILEKLAAPFQVDGLEVTATCSLGIALFPANGKHFENLLKHADMAMYQAKASGRNAMRFFDEKMNTDVAEHLHLISAMRSGLQNGEFSLHYQPQYRLPDQKIVGAEALLRWQHPQLGSVSPAKFIPLAERSGLIVDIGAWVLHEACRQASAWQKAGLEHLVIDVNVSPVQLRREGFESEVQYALAAAGLPPTCLGLELTESLLIADSLPLRELLGRLRATGVRVSIDDFGTGYSSLSYLRQFDVERLKIDQSFIQGLSSETGGHGIVRAIIQVAASLELEAVAEGVEDAQTLQRLIELGCDYAQGFHWSPALPPDDFFQFVQKQR
jgi:diguanylate cyclase